MSVEFTVISIGTLSHNRLWGESVTVRTAHATISLVSEKDRLILVDPSLPATALAARFGERTGKTLADVTDVFCTNLRLAHRRGVEAVPRAKWWASELELLSYRGKLDHLLASADRLSEEDAAAARASIAMIERFSPAPDKFSEQVSLFPTPGPTEGATGLLLSPPDMTVAVAGDAALTIPHVEGGQVWDGCHDVSAAADSLRELLEIAEVIVTGHDNLMVAPRGRWI
jgi:glyoxylase-like metal-dependent hydrolase (beta-lactamase superfamily II)